MPAHPLLRRLLARAAVPVAAPSANPFGYVSPTTARHVADSLGRKIRHILDGGAAQIGLESTILDLRDEARPRLLRPGAITRKQIERALGRRVAAAPRRAARKALPQIAPGMLARHYSPHTPVVLHERLARTTPANEAFVFLRKPAGRLPPNVFWLDAKGSLPGAARRLFATLRRVDAMGWKKIHVERARGQGLADAINDRLRRAAG
jgi:L-threonylcarbamoyladenylate synthase